MHGALPLQSAGSLKRVKIWTAKILPSLETPFGGSPAPWLVLKPAAMPATCVPCSQSCTDPLMHCAVAELAAPAPVCVGVPFGHRLTVVGLPSPPAPASEKHASAITLPARNS